MEILAMVFGLRLDQVVRSDKIVSAMDVAFVIFLLDT